MGRWKGERRILITFFKILYFEINNIENGILTIEETKFYISMIVLTIEYLHNNKILFRDINPENIIIDEKVDLNINYKFIIIFYVKIRVT